MSDAEKTERRLGLPSAEPWTTRDVRLPERALRESWDLSLDATAAMIKRLEAIVSDPASKPRAFERASKALMALSRINLTVVDTAIRARHADRIADQVKAL